ncbi:phosphoenolpyruvate carboxykinase (ATP) [Chloroflexota bacterium]
MPEFDIEQFVITANKIRDTAKGENRLTDNPTEPALREILSREPGIKKTIYNNFAAESEPTSRSAPFTKNSVDTPFGEDELTLLKQCEEALGKEKLVSIDRVVGNPNSETTVRLIIPERFAHIAYGGGNLFIPPTEEVKEPTYQIIFFADDAFEANKSKPLPEKDITIRLAMFNDGRYVKIIRNGNYIGEYKKGVFAAEDWFAKTRRGGIFLHGGCREDYLESIHGKYETKRTLLIALSANGKTTTTSRILAKKGNEKSWLVQDDGGTLMPDGSFRGFEAGGLFVKTEGVNPGEQTEIYYSLLKPETVCENVKVNDDGDYDFYDYQRTSNGRAVVLRKDVMHASSFIDVERLDNIILITRGNLIPAISRLNREQAAALMVLGQAMESSAGDPTKAGSIRTEFFYDPFIAGDRADHANRFYDLIKGQEYLNFYLLNTGGVGEGENYHDIKLEHTMGVLDALIRGALEEWVESPTGFQVPKAIKDVDDIYLHPEKAYSEAEFTQKQKEMDTIRYEAVEKIGDGLNPEIKKVFTRG